jgi:hypothetical protein
MKPGKVPSQPPAAHPEFYIPKLVFLGFVTAYVFSGFWRYDNLLFVHNFNLIIHEAGHAIFRLFGEFFMFLGGTLLQLMVPIGITVYFLVHRQYYSGAITLHWTTINLLDVSRYMKDARTQQIPLLGGEAVTHDWWWLFGQMNLLPYDQLIGNAVFFIGFLVFMWATFVGVYHSWVAPPKP